MKIGVFVRCLHNGGTERVTAKLSLLWRGLGYETIFFTYLDRTEGEFEHACCARERVDESGLTEERVRELQVRYGFTVCVIAGEVASVASRTIIRTFSKMSNVRVVGMMHHSFSTWQYSLCCSGDFELLPYLKQIDVFVCVDAIQALWWHNLGAPALYIPNPVAMEPIGERRAVSGYELVWSGRLTDPYKRARQMVAIFCEVHKRFPAARLTMLGSCTESVKRGLMSLIPDSARGAISIVGYVPDTTPFLQKAYLNVFTSQFEVTVPQAILEAQAVGLPTVALDMPSFAPLGIADGLVKAKSDKELVAAIVDLLDNLEEREDLADKALYAAHRRANTHKEVDGWRKLFESIGNGCSLSEFIGQRVKELSTVENHRNLLNEIQRAQYHFWSNHLPTLMKTRLWTGRIQRLLRLLKMETHG